MVPISQSENWNSYSVRKLNNNMDYPTCHLYTRMPYAALQGALRPFWLPWGVGKYLVTNLAKVANW